MGDFAFVLLLTLVTAPAINAQLKTLKGKFDLNPVLYRKMVSRDEMDSVKSELDLVKTELKSVLGLLKAEQKQKVSKTEMESGKSELELVKTELKSELDLVKTEQKQKISKAETESVKSEMDSVKAELKSELDLVKTEQKQKVSKAEMESVKSEMDSVKAELKSELDLVKTEQKQKVSKAEMESVKSEMDSVKAELKSELDSVKAELKSLKSEFLSNVPKSSKHVSFQVKAKKTHTLVNDYEKLKFDTVTLNTGGGYSAATGIFTAPVTGMYLLYANILGMDRNVIFIELFKENVSLMTGFSSRDILYGLATINYLVKVNKGEQVWFRKKGDTPEIHGDFHSVYGGVLLYVL